MINYCITRVQRRKSVARSLKTIKQVHTLMLNAYTWVVLWSVFILLLLLVVFGGDVSVTINWNSWNGLYHQLSAK